MTITKSTTKERPILFSGPMVRAILDGRKTQTRRVVTVHWHKGRRCQPYSPYYEVDDGKLWAADDAGEWYEVESPFGSPGDRLWVRETWGVGSRPDPFDGWRDGIEYRADEAYLEEHDLLPLYGEGDGIVAPGDFYADYNKTGWRPSIHMPRWASRITLEVTGVRVERVRDISEEDAIAEGCSANFGMCSGPMDPEEWDGTTAVDEFAALWDSINAKRGYGWDKNPWVWAISFKVVTP